MRTRLLASTKTCLQTHAGKAAVVCMPCFPTATKVGAASMHLATALSPCLALSFTT